MGPARTGQEVSDDEGVMGGGWIRKSLITPVCKCPLALLFRILTKNEWEGGACFSLSPENKAEV